MGQTALLQESPRESHRFEPDVLPSNEDSFDLSPYGVTGTVKHKAGQRKYQSGWNSATARQWSATCWRREFFIGGILRTGHAIRPPFEDGPAAVRKELLRLVDLRFERFHVGHGGSVEAHEVRRYAESSPRIGRRIPQQPKVRPLPIDRRTILPTAPAGETGMPTLRACVCALPSHHACAARF